MRKECNTREFTLWLVLVAAALAGSPGEAQEASAQTDEAAAESAAPGDETDQEADAGAEEDEVQTRGVRRPSVVTAAPGGTASFRLPRQLVGRVRGLAATLRDRPTRDLQLVLGKADSKGQPVSVRVARQAKVGASYRIFALDPLKKRILLPVVVRIGKPQTDAAARAKAEANAKARAKAKARARAKAKPQPKTKPAPPPRIAAQPPKPVAKPPTLKPGAVQVQIELLRLQGARGDLTVHVGDPVQVLTYEAVGGTPPVTLDFSFPRNANAAEQGGFYRLEVPERPAATLIPSAGLASRQMSGLGNKKLQERTEAIRRFQENQAAQQEIERRTIRFKAPAAPRENYATLRVSARDAAGQQTSLTVVIDVLAPPPPTIANPDRGAAGGFFSEFRRNASGFRWDNCYLLASASFLGDKPSLSVRRTLEAWGFDSDKVEGVMTPGLNLNAYIASNDRMILAVFRGTDPMSLANIGVDIDMLHAPRDNRYYRGEKPRLHNGFKTATDSLFPHVHDYIERFGTAPDGSEKPLWVTGHSLGGAMATLTAARLKKAGHLLPALYTFAAPRVGNHHFIADFTADDRFPESRYHRVINQADIVPHVPPAGPAFGYRHNEFFRWIVPDEGHAIRRTRSDDLGFHAHNQTTLRVIRVMKHSLDEYIELIFNNRPNSRSASAFPPPLSFVE